MNSLDWGIVVLYIGILIGVSYRVGKKFVSKRDYYLGGSNVHWLPTGISTMATQLSTNSMLGAPAFVAFSVGGGLLWLQYELAVPLAMIIIMAFFIPFFRKAKVISIYEYLEIRLGPKTRTSLSIIFQFFVAFQTGVTIYGISLVLQTVLDIPFVTAVILLGVVTVIYDTLGGMKSVIFSDVMQMTILVFGIFFVSYYAVNLTGGLDAVFENFDKNRLVAIDFSGTGLGDNATFAFLPMLIGGLFLYVSYYGCNQTQAQRQLSTKNLDDSYMSLFMNGMLRFPVVVGYVFLGVAIGAYAAVHTGFIDMLPTRETTIDGVVQAVPNFNTAVPVFVLNYLPHGIIGLIIVALFAAAMSSLDSTLNSLSAVSIRDIFERYSKKFRSRKEKDQLLFSKIMTLFWGIVCISFSFVTGNISDSIIVSINKIVSMFNGPILAAFLLAIFTKRTNDKGAVIGIIGGFVVNVYVWIFMPGVSWLWWNVIGTISTFIIGLTASYFFKAPDISGMKDLIWNKNVSLIKEESSRNWNIYYLILVAMFLFMILVLSLI